jgi:hypothetical protein
MRKASTSSTSIKYVLRKDSIIGTGWIDNVTERSNYTSIESGKLKQQQYFHRSEA